VTEVEPVCCRTNLVLEVAEGGVTAFNDQFHVVIDARGLERTRSRIESEVPGQGGAVLNTASSIVQKTGDATAGTGTATASNAKTRNLRTIFGLSINPDARPGADDES
jgi:hypothetical protein